MTDVAVTLTGFRNPVAFGGLFVGYLEYVQSQGDGLEAEGIVELFEIELSNNQGYLFLKNNQDLDYLGDTYEGIAIKIDGVDRRSSEEASRPKLMVANPEGIWTALIRQGKLNRALVVRKRVPRSAIESNTELYSQQQWKIMRVSTINNRMAGFELRELTDGFNQLTPARMYIPPEFPTVSLQ